MNVSTRIDLVSDFIEKYKDLFFEIEVTSSMNMKTLSGWIIHFFKYLGFEGFVPIDYVGEWEESKEVYRLTTGSGWELYPRRIHFLYRGEKPSDILSVRVMVKPTDLDEWMNLFRELIGVESRSAIAGILESRFANKVTVKLFNDKKKFAEYVSDIGKVYLSSKDFESWVSWSKWIIKVTKILGFKEMRAIARSV